MRDVPQSMTDAWKAELKIGQNRPVVRATIQRTFIRKWAYDTANALGGDDRGVDQHTTGYFTSAIFGNPTPVREIQNIRSCEWQRSLDQDSATCTLVLSNAAATPVGQAGDPNQDFDRPGYFTAGRGQTATSVARWGYARNEWANVFVPDALVKTYEGYGTDGHQNPGEDSRLVQSGTWLIDTVTYNDDGTITLEMRDLARLLLESVAFPPIVPRSQYPIAFTRIDTRSVPGRDAAGGKWIELKGKGKARSSNELYIGKGISQGTGRTYVTKGGGVDGHYPSHALVESRAADGWDSYWMSTGQDAWDDKVWWEVEFNDHTTALNAIRIQTKGTAYVYISLMGPNGWIGRKKIPYKVGVGGVDIGADIPFVAKVRAEYGATFDTVLPRKYANIRKVRLTFTNLTRFSPGAPHQFQIGLRDMHIYTAPNVNSLKFKSGKILKSVGNYRDYTDIVRLVCAWGGFYHPDPGTGDDWVNLGTTRKTITRSRPDKYLASGRVWGDLMMSGTAGIADLTPDLFDKKPLMDMINYVRDLLGFIFFVDEVGGIIWRMPNIWKSTGVGNYKWGGHYEPRDATRGRTSTVLTIDENETLLSYSTKLSSNNIRERIFVANSVGKIGTVIEGYNPVPTGMRRIAGWTDQRFETKREAVVMADMVAARAMFEYRRGSVKIPGYPAIQMDDQIRIIERVTNETYYHYVMGVTSTIDMEEGTWDYDLDTHWLGETPEAAWVVDSTELKAETRSYLNLTNDGSN